MEECGYFEDLKKSCKTEQEADSRQENVRELLNALTGYCQRHPRDGARGFLDGLVLEQEREEEKAEERDGVTLMTLHAAKGLEYPEVWLVGAEDGILPYERSKSEGTVEEERRLLYVGITRARHHLTITHCSTRRKFGSVMSWTPSSFLLELAGEGVESGSTEEILAHLSLHPSSRAFVGKSLLVLLSFKKRMTFRKWPTPTQSKLRSSASPLWSRRQRIILSRLPVRVARWS